MKAFMSIIVFLLSTSIALSENILLKAGEDYEISVPNNWIEIPQDILQQYQIAVFQTTGQRHEYDYGYQSQDVLNWLEHPYALIQIKRSGRIPEGQLKNYKKLDSAFQEGLEELKESTGDIFSDMSQGETLYDSNDHVLWSNISMDVTGVGTIQSIVALKLTEYGYIQFMGYSTSDEFSTYSPLFKKMVRSITTSEVDQYKPKLTDNAPSIFGINLAEVIIAGVIGAALAGALVLLKKLLKKNSTIKT